MLIVRFIHCALSLPLYSAPVSVTLVFLSHLHRRMRIKGRGLASSNNPVCFSDRSCIVGAVYVDSSEYSKIRIVSIKAVILGKVLVLLLQMMICILPDELLIRIQ